MKMRLQSFSATQIIIGAYVLAVVLFTLLLLLPVSLKPGVRLSLADTLFIAVSAVSVTGLTPVNIVETFSMFGQGVMLVAFQFGGIGIMTLGTLLWLLLGQNITLSQRRLIMIDQNQNQLAGLVRLLLVIVRIALLVEITGTLVFALYFKAAGYAGGFFEALYYALFHAISSYTNAGFDIFGDSLLGYAEDYVVQLLTMLLIVLGAIGFPVLVELREFLLGNRKNFRFSLFTKITSMTYLALMILGAAAIWCMERGHFLAGKAWHAQMFYALFNSVTSRSAGLATMEMAELGQGTQFLMSILMFIGGSPSSAGGGVRTTTFAVIILTLIAVARSRQEVTVWKRTLKREDVHKSFFVFALASLLCAGSILALDVMEARQFPIGAVIFEVMSAFGTCGASLGITPELSVGGKALLMALMLIGRVGLITLLTAFHNERHRPANIRYPEEKIIIG